MATVCVFEILSNSNEIAKLTSKKEICLLSVAKKQLELKDLGIGAPEPSQPTTTLKLKEEKDSLFYFEAKQEDETSFEPIKVYKWDLFENQDNSAGNPSIVTTHGYQLIYKFEIVVDCGQNLLYIFSDKGQAELLVHRLKNSGFLEVRNCRLNLSKVSNIPNIVDEWGMWLDSRGQILKKAYFGTNLHKVKEGRDEQITSYDVSYRIKDVDGKETDISLIISHYGRISSNSNSAKNDVLLKIFRSIKSATD